MDNVVYQAIRRDYRNRVASRSSAIDKREGLEIELRSCDALIQNNNEAIHQHVTFARRMGWDISDWDQ